MIKQTNNEFELYTLILVGHIIGMTRLWLLGVAGPFVPLFKLVVLLDVTTVIM